METPDEGVVIAEYPHSVHRAPPVATAMPVVRNVYRHYTARAIDQRTRDPVLWAFALGTRCATGRASSASCAAPQRAASASPTPGSYARTPRLDRDRCRRSSVRSAERLNGTRPLQAQDQDAQRLAGARSAATRCIDRRLLHPGASAVRQPPSASLRPCGPNSARAGEPGWRLRFNQQREADLRHRLIRVRKGIDRLSRPIGGRQNARAAGRNRRCTANCNRPSIVSRIGRPISASPRP